MTDLDKIRIKLEHELHHGSHHREDYVHLAGDLRAAGTENAARELERLVMLQDEAGECLRRALEALGGGSDHV